MNSRLKKRLNYLKRKIKFSSGNFKLDLERNAKKMRKNMTTPELLFKMIVDELKIKYELQKIIGNKIYDFYLPEHHMLVEIDGDYYHSNPELVSESEQNNMQKRNIKNDKYKDVLASGMGYKLERVWENDLKNNYVIVKKKFELLKNEK